MTNTTLSAKIEQIQFAEQIAQTVTFRNEKHKRFFLEYLPKCRYADVYHAAGVKESDFGCMCKIAEGLGICVHELRADEKGYTVSIQKDTLAKLIVVSEINGVELDELIHTILEKGIEEYGFYE